ncbi:hypothetical protein TKK_0008750 [Trichogramma kaykai]|uniref:Methyltransferase domain-containing protein n=1 Tax=Trichogramma kaykai TaxID=54128 RepID=A0ABD2X2L4_9HYME
MTIGRICAKASRDLRLQGGEKRALLRAAYLCCVTKQKSLSEQQSSAAVATSQQTPNFNNRRLSSAVFSRLVLTAIFHIAFVFVNNKMEQKVLDEIGWNTPGMTPESKRFSMILAGIFGGVGIAITAISLPFCSPAFRRICLPFCPASNEQVQNVMKALKGKQGTLLDIGSGDGRIVIAAAKAGFKADGVELNQWLIRYSKLSALFNGVSSKTNFFRKDLFQFNMQKYNNVVIFGVDEMMHEIEAKFKKELKPNSSIVACRFPLPNCKPIKTMGTDVDTVWLYETPLQKQ